MIEIDANRSKISIYRYVNTPEYGFFFLRNVYRRPHYTVERIVDKFTDRYWCYRSSSKVQLVRTRECLVTRVWFIYNAILRPDVKENDRGT